MNRLPSPDDLLRNRKAPANGPATYEEELDARVAREAAYRASLAKPDEAASANRIARARGIPSPVVRGNLSAFEQQERARAFADLVKRNPAISRWGSDVRNLEVGADDAAALGKVATGMDWSKNPYSIKAPPKAEAGVWGFLKGVYESFRTSMVGAEEQFKSNLPKPSFVSNESWRYAEQQGQKRLEMAIQRSGEAAPDFESSTMQGLYSGASSLAIMAPGIALSVATRNTAPGLASAGILSETQAYAKYRARGATNVEANVGGMAEGAIEVATELLPLGVIVDRYGTTSVKRWIAEYLIKEGLGEQAATHAQDAVDTIIANPDKTWGEFFAERPDAAYQTALATLVSGTVIGGTSEGSRMYTARKMEAEAAEKAATQIDGLMEASASSKTRGRDPEAFMALIAEMAEDGGVDRLYVPAEAVQSYMQSEGYGGEFDSFRGAVDEGLATGGDVVIPIDVAAAQIAGTPAWSAIREDARITPGGMSMREAQAFNEAAADIMADLSERMDRDVAQARAELEPRLKLVESVAAKLQDAGFTPHTARQQAELLAQRAATRSARMGQELTGQEYDTLAVNQVLPERLAAAQKADGLDFVINAMKRKADVNAKPGVSLLEFISGKGGVADPGGDLASMGAQDWHKGKAFRKKLIQDQGRTLDDLAMAAFEAGYFPGLTDRPTINDLLDAMGRELGGSPVFANFASEDAANADAAQADLVKATDELRSLLAEAGIDPDTATAREIKAAVAQYAEGQAQGQQFDQVSPEQARAIDMPVELPSDPLFAEAVANTPGASITDEGLLIDLVRYQKEEQGGATSVRTGVFYLPTGSASAKFYKGGKNAYGGRVEVRGETLIKRPIFVKGATGGKAPEAAYDAIKGKKAYENMRTAALKVAMARGGLREEVGYNFLEEYGADGDLIHDILPASTQGNTLAYALQENVVAHAVREAGYDAVLGYSVGRGGKGAFLSEVFDVREIDYPAPGEQAVLHPQFDQVSALYQSFSGGPRGRITFPAQGYGTGKTVIDLFQSRNQSTFLHEAGHLWLEELRFDASDPNAPEQLKADWQAVQDWFKANGHPLQDGVIPVEAHEMWARGVERYLMEGKVPVPALRRIFEAVKTWFVQVYRTADRLNAPITDDIRAVMDRLIATDVEIAEAKQAQAIEAAFTEKPATMSDEEWAGYQELVQGSRDDAQSTMLGKVMSAVKRRVTKEYNEQKAAVREEVKAEIDSRPEFRALRQLRETPIDQASIADIYGSDALAMLPKQVPPVYKANGANPNDVAELSGFASADEMVRTLMGVETRRRELREGGDRRSVREVMIAQETDARMLERYGDPFTDGSIEEEALAAIHNDKAGEVMAAELRVLSRGTRNRPTPYSVAKAWAAKTIREGLVRDTTSRAAIQRYRRAAAKAGAAVQKAILSGDADAAFQNKQAQMLNNALLAEASRVAEEVDSAVKRLSNWAKRKTIKSVDQDYLERAQSLLSAVEMRPRSQRSLDKQAGFEKWAAEQEALGHDIVVPASFAASLGSTHWSRLSVDQFLGLDAAVTQIIHLGRYKQTLLDGKEAREFDEVVGEALTQTQGERRRPPVDGFLDPSAWRRGVNFVMEMDAYMLKAETIFSWLDGDNPNGVYDRVVFQPLVEAQEKRRVLVKEKSEKIAAAREKIPSAIRRRWHDKVTLSWVDRETGAAAVVTRDQLIVMALNIGNAGNAQKLAGGYKTTEAVMKADLDRHLSQEEWQFVQEVWDILDEFWPASAALERRINGVEPEKVEARPVETPYGTLRGGYYPISYDPTRNLVVERNKAKEDGTFYNGVSRPNTRSGSLNERTDVELPIWLSMATIDKHIVEMAHDITHREPLMNAYKFLNDPRIVREIREVLGTEIQKQLNPWLDHIAREWTADTTGTAAMEKAIKSVRANATFVGLAYRASTGILQVAGLSNSTEFVGAKWMGTGLSAFMKNPVESTNFVLENSNEVRGRLENNDRDIRDAIRRETSRTGLWSDARRFGYLHIGYIDRFVSVVTWIGAYNKGLSEGMTDAQASAYGDKAVRRSQGSGGAKDMAAIQRGKGTAGEAGKLLTMYYTYQSQFYQRQRTLGRDYGKAIRARSVADMPALLARTMWLYFVPALATELLAGRGPEEDEEWSEWAIKTVTLAALGPLPVIRDIAGAIGSGFGYNFTPASGLGRTGVAIWRDMAKIIKGEETKRATRDIMEGLGYLGAPISGQVAASTQFLVDVAHGDQDPRTFGDWYQGLVKGRISED